MDWKQTLLKDARERPVETGLAVGTMGIAAITAAAKVLELLASARSKNAYAKNLRRKNSNKK